MLSTPQIIVEILAGLFFIVVAIACLLWPKKFYEHALRPVCRNSDIHFQNMQRGGYVWSVRIVGVIAAMMFIFVVIHLYSSTPIGHQGPARTDPVPGARVRHP
jgi:hypothetical protein